LIFLYYLLLKQLRRLLQLAHSVVRILDDDETVIHSGEFILGDEFLLIGIRVVLFGQLFELVADLLEL